MTLGRLSRVGRGMLTLAVVLFLVALWLQSVDRGVRTPWWGVVRQAWDGEWLAKGTRYVVDDHGLYTVSPGGGARVWGRLCWPDAEGGGVWRLDQHLRPERIVARGGCDGPGWWTVGGVH